jgi:hypothetical protein
MQIVSIVTPVILGTLLTGCGTSTKVVNMSADGVSIVFDGDASTLPEVNQMAGRECQKNGRIAVMRTITEVEEGRMASFDCRAPATTS